MFYLVVGNTYAQEVLRAAYIAGANKTRYIFLNAPRNKFKIVSECWSNCKSQSSSYIYCFIIFIRLLDIIYHYYHIDTVTNYTCWRVLIRQQYYATFAVRFYLCLRTLAYFHHNNKQTATFLRPQKPYGSLFIFISFIFI